MMAEAFVMIAIYIVPMIFALCIGAAIFEVALPAIAKKFNDKHRWK